MKANFKIVSEEELKIIEAPKGTENWRPRSHREILDGVKNACDAAGLNIEQMQLLIFQQAQRFLGFLQTKSEIVRGQNLIVGVGNATDQSFSQRVFYGFQGKENLEVLLGSNPETKKNSKNVADNFAEVLACVPESSKEYLSSTREMVDKMSRSPIENQAAESIILRTYEKDILPIRCLSHAIENWRQVSKVPEDKNQFSLLMAISSSFRKRIYARPKLYVDKSIFLRDFFEEELKRAE